MHPSATAVSRAVAVAIEWAGMDDWVGECMVLESAATTANSDSSRTVHFYSLEKAAQAEKRRRKRNASSSTNWYLLLLPPNNAPKA